MTTTSRAHKPTAMVATATDLTQLVRRAEAAVLGAVGHDPSGEDRADAGQRVELCHRGGVEVQQATRPGPRFGDGLGGHADDDQPRTPWSFSAASALGSAADAGSAADGGSAGQAAATTTPPGPLMRCSRVRAAAVADGSGRR